VMVSGRENSPGRARAQRRELGASNGTVGVLKDTGHWVVEGRPKEPAEALRTFLWD